MENGNNILEWKVYESTTKSTFRNLYTDEAFADVTLACEGNKKVLAHRVVLSACSDFFKQILQMHPNPHPLIYLQGINTQDLILLKMFMYLGKATVENENMTSFISAAKLFLNKESKMEINAPEITTKTTKDVSKSECVETLSEQVEEEFNDMHMIPGQITHEKDILKSSNLKCFEKLQCDQCDWNTLDRDKLSKHYRDQHGPELCCAKCKFKTRRNYMLINHDKAKHQNIKFYCDICGLEFSTKDMVRSHKTKNHRNINEI